MSLARLLLPTLLLVAPGVGGGVRASPPQVGARPSAAPADTVRVAVLRDWPPHYRVQPDGTPGGFAVDVMEAVAERADLVAVYVPYGTFPRAMEALDDGEVDVIPDLGVIDSRSDEFAFTRAFDAFRISLVVRDSETRMESIEDLAGMTVGVVRENAAVPLLRETRPEADLVVFDNVREALFELLAAGVDAVAYPEEVFFALAREAEVGDRIRAVPGSLMEVPRAMGVRRGDTVLLGRLDRGLDALIGTPEYEEIYQRWFSPPVPFWTPERVALMAAGLLVLVLAGMAAWRYRSVSRLASELERSLKERDEAEAARREENERFRTLVETAYEGILLVDEENRVAFVNRRICELVGMPEEEIVGKHLLRFVPEEDRSEVRKHMSLRRRGVSDTYEVRIRRADGTALPVLLTAAPLAGESGEFRGAVGTITDISDRVRAEEELERRERRFRAFAENSSDLISNLDREGRMIYQSPPLKRLLGWDPEEIRGESVFDYIHPDDREEARRAWKELVSEPGRTMELSRFRFRHKDGSWRTWESTLTNLLEDPDVGAVLSNARDITEREELEQQLRRSQRLEAVGRLAGGIAHDFNNILTVIRAESDLILMDLDSSEELASDVETIREASDRATNLTSQLLAFSRDQVLRPRILDPGEVFREFERLISRTLGEDIRIEMDPEDEAPPIRVDPGQLDQALLNLTINARDAMPDGGTLTLSTGTENIDPEHSGWDPSLEAGTYVRMDVSDTGVGMDEETVERIFEPFFTTKSDRGGSGLGLAMVYGIVRQSGGMITVDSAPGRGTRFSLYFPSVEGQVPERVEVDVGGGVGEGAAPRETAVSEEDRLSGRILLVEDDASVRRVAREILARAGLDVETASDVEGALRALETSGNDFQVVVTDLVLPGARGGRLIGILRERWPEVAVVAMSGYAEAGEEAGGLPPDVHFVRKPFTPEDFGAVVRNAMAGRPG